jgi:hypothetical protein
MAERGIVVAPRFEFDGVALRFPGVVGLEAADLRHYLLYWDRIDFPNNNLISIGNTPDIDFLITSGVLTRTQVALHQFSGNFGIAYVLAQLAAFEELNRREPACWSIGQATVAFVNPESSAAAVRAIEVDLTCALPVPAGTVSLADVLEFKRRRNAELMALRYALDQMYLQISNARDIPRARDASINSLERTLVELHKASSEAWPSRALRSVKVELNIPNIVSKAAAGAASAFAFGLPPAVGAGAGAVMSAIKFDVRELRTPKLPQHLKDFAYVFHAQRELH